MHRHRKHFSGGKFNNFKAADLGVDNSDSTGGLMSSLSSLSAGDDDHDDHNWERRTSRFVQSTFRNSDTSQDDMAVPHRKSVEFKPRPVPETAKAKTKKGKGKSAKAADDSKVGNYSLRTRLKPHPADDKISKRHILEQTKQGGKITLSNTTLSEELKVTTREDLSRSLVDKLGKGQVMNQNRAVGRRRASTTALSGTTYHDASKDEDGKERSKSGHHAPRRGRSGSLRGRFRSVPEETQEAHRRRTEEKDQKDAHHSASRHRHDGKQEDRSGRHQKRSHGDHSPRAASGDHFLKDRSADGSSRRHHHLMGEGSSRRNHRFEHSRRPVSNSPEGSEHGKPKERDGHSPTRKGEHEHRRHKENNEEKDEHSRHRGDSNKPRARSHSYSHRKEHRHRRANQNSPDDKEKQQRNRGHDHSLGRRRSHSHSPRGRSGHGRNLPPENDKHHNRSRHSADRHGHHERRTEARKRSSPSPPELKQLPEQRKEQADAVPTDPPARSPRRTRGSMIVVNVPKSALPAASDKKEKPGSRPHHRDEKHGGHKERGGRPSPHRHRGPRGEHAEKPERKKKLKPKLKRFRSRSTGHLPSKRDPHRVPKGGKSVKPKSKAYGSKEMQETTSSAPALGKKAAVDPRSRVSVPDQQQPPPRRGRPISAPAVESVSTDQHTRPTLERSVSPPPVRGLNPRRRVSLSLPGRPDLQNKQQSRPNLQNFKQQSQSMRQLTMDTGRRRSISPRRGLTNQHTGGSKSSQPDRYKASLMKQESMQSEGEGDEPKPLKRHSSLSKLDNLKRKSMMLNPQANAMLNRARMGFLDESISFSDSDDEDFDRQMSQDRLVSSIQMRLRVSDVSTSPDDFAGLSAFDVTDKSEEQETNHMSENLDHIDFTALRPSQIREVLGRAGQD